MYDVSENYLNTILEDGTQHTLKIYINGTAVEDIFILGCSIEHQLFSSDEFEFGSVEAKTCEIKLYKTALSNSTETTSYLNVTSVDEMTVEELNETLVEALSGTGTLYNTIYYDTIDSIYIESGIDDETVPIGYFTLDEISEDDDSTITIKGIDYMVQFEFNYDGSELNYPATLLEVLEDICDQAGVELGSTTFLNSDSEISVYDSTITARTYIGYIAELAGGFATIGRDGKLYIKTIGESTYELSIDNFEKFSWGEEFIVSRIAYEDGVQDFKTGDTTNNTIWINSDNMYVVSQDQIDNIYNNCNVFSCYSFSGSSIIDPALDVGDLLLIDDKLVIYQGSMEYKGKFKASIESDIQAKEQEDTTATTISETTKIRRVQSSIDQVEGTITQLVQETSEYEETLTQVQQDVDSIKQLVSDTIDYEREVSGVTEIYLEDAGEANILELQVDGNTTYEANMFPSTTVYPYSSIYPNQGGVNR